jgi:hypothetical protein
VESEAEQRSLNEEHRAELRRLRTVPVLEKFQGWLRELQNQAPPQGLLGKRSTTPWGSGIDWNGMSNMACFVPLIISENAIRPFGVGKTGS